MSIDVGSHLTLLGLLWLSFKYLLPVIFGLVLIGGAWYAFRQIQQMSGLNLKDPNVLMLLIAVAALIIIIAVT
jgi:hypothetical protein